MVHAEEILRSTRPLPANLGVVSGSTPIVSFGQFDSARVASIGINPSHREFQSTGGDMLEGAKARFVSRKSLGVDDAAPLSEPDAERVVLASREYFSANPYRPWFNPMEKWVLSAFGASYWQGSATHLDLSQWATRPVWKFLSPSQQQTLLTHDADFLRWQIHHRQFETVVVNGKGAITQLAEANIATLELVDHVTWGNLTIEIWETEQAGTRFVGWNRYLQSAMPKELRHALREWLFRKG